MDWARAIKNAIDYIEENVTKKIVTEWLPSSDFVFVNAPEVAVMHWRPSGEREKERYIEIRLPIEKRT